MFSIFEQMLTSAERVTFTIQKGDGNTLKVFVAPGLKAAPDNLDEESANLRAALSIPLVVSGTGEELDSDFPRCLTQYSEQRVALSGSLSVLDTLREANKKASKAVDKVKAGGKAAGKAPTPTVADEDDESDSASGTVESTVPPPVTSVVGATNPESLF